MRSRPAPVFTRRPRQGAERGRRRNATRAKAAEDLGSRQQAAQGPDEIAGPRERSMDDALHQYRGAQLFSSDDSQKQAIRPGEEKPDEGSSFN